MAVTGTKALEVWCRQVTAGYTNVNILNMTTSWRSGLGFCAIIHHFCPHLIDYEGLDPDDVFGNNSLAFSTAEQHLGIPSLLDPHDMVECELLDRLSILTYLSQYYQVLTNQSNSVINVAANPVVLQSADRSGKPGQGDRCQQCDKPVYLLERLNVGGRIIHRTCFKCARCEEQLTLASFYETETGQFCCEVCPDEEDSQRKRTLKVRKDFQMLMADEAKAEEADHENSEDEEDEVKVESENASIDIPDSTPSEHNITESRDEDPADSNDNIEVQITFETEDTENIEAESINDRVAEDKKSDEGFDSNDCSSSKDELGRKESYPEDSNPFGDDPEPSNEAKHISESNIVESSNPFGSDLDSGKEEHEEESCSNFSSAPNISNSQNVSSHNPFGSDLSEDEAPPVPASPSLSVSSSSQVPRKKRLAPKPPTPRMPVAAPRPSVENVKSKKDAANINRKNELLSNSASKEVEKMTQDKADEGQWRRKKGPAPPRPLPPKRSVKKLARKAINQELFDIEVKQVGLEKQGVKLEKSIREICATNDAVEGADRDSLGPEAEDLIIQLFDLVNEKNELFRRQTELIYMKKENRLEELHADLEYQIRVLMSKPESQRTDDDQASEERLIAKLVEVVSQRNFIVDCLEMDRRRELDEDTAIEDHMSSYAAVKPEEKNQIALMKMLKRRKKKKKNKDDEKDVDTSEMKGNEEEKQKKKSAKKKLVSLTTKKLNSLNLTLKKQ